jgi:hypothetical protein
MGFINRLIQPLVTQVRTDGQLIPATSIGAHPGAYSLMT